MVIYHAPATVMEQMAGASSEDMEKGMESWMEWAAKCGDALVDFGTPLGGGQKLSETGSTPSDRHVTGYSVLQAEDMDGAKALLQGHPHLWMGGGLRDRGPRVVADTVVGPVRRGPHQRFGASSWPPGGRRIRTSRPVPHTLTPLCARDNIDRDLNPIVARKAT